MGAKELFTPHPSLAVVKFWQGAVEIILRVVAIVTTAIAFFSAIALVHELGSPETIIDAIEQLRFDTRSPSGWIMLVTIIVLPLETVILIIRFLNLEIINNYSTLFFIVDAIISGVIALFFFGGAIPLAVHSEDWRFWKSQGTEFDIERFRINQILNSAGAASAFCFFATFAFAFLAVWMLLFALFKWHENMTKYSPDLVKVTTVGKSAEDTSPVAPPRGQSPPPKETQSNGKSGEEP